MAGAQTLSDHHYYNNLIINNTYGIEHFMSDLGSTVDDYLIDHNTILYSGLGFGLVDGHTTAMSFRFSEAQIGTTNVTIRDNIIGNSTNREFVLGNFANNWRAPITLDYNWIIDDLNNANFMSWNGIAYTDYGTWQFNTAQNSNGDNTSVNYINLIDFQPENTEPVCTLSSTGSYVGAVPCLALGVPSTNISSMYPHLSTKSFTDNFQHYTVDYPFNKRWSISGDGTWITQSYPTSYGYNNYMITGEDSGSTYLIARNITFNQSTDDYEIITQVTPANATYCWIQDSRDNKNAIFYYDILDQVAIRYNDGASHIFKTEIKWLANETKWLRMQFNHTTTNYSYHYKNNTNDTWSYLATYRSNDTASIKNVIMKSTIGVCAFDNVVARKTNNPEAGGILYPSFLYQSLNDTQWYNATIDFYNGTVKTYTDVYSLPTDYTDFSRTIYRGVWYINVTLCDVNGVCRTEISSNLTVDLFNIYPCSVKGVPTLNFTITHEDFPQTVDLIADVEISGSVWLYDNPSIINNYNFSLSGDSNYALCFYPENYILSTDMYIKYYVDEGFTHRYIFVNETLTDDVQYLTIYNFNYTAVALGISDLVLTLRNKNNYQYLTNIIATLQRWYVGENTWRNVQMDESGAFGLMLFNIYEEDVDYRLVFRDRYNYETILETTKNMRFFCTSNVCDLTYLINPNPISYIQDNFSITQEYIEEEDIINITWVDPDGYSFIINNIVRRVMFNQSLIICNDTVEDTVSGYYECDVTGLTGTFIITSKTSRSPYEDQKSTIINIIGATFEDLVGVGKTESTFWAFGILTTMIMFGAIISPVGAIITAIIGLIAIFLLKMLSVISVAYIIIVMVIGIMISIKIKN